MTDAAFDSWVERARNVPIERVIEQRGIRLNGGKIEREGPCPLCGGEDRFSINTKKQVFNCRGCNIGGDVIALVEHLDRVDFIAAATSLAGEPPPTANGKYRAVEPKKVVAAEYAYHDENGVVAFVVERVEYRNPDGTFVRAKGGKRKKTFRQRRWDPGHSGAWLWNVDGVPALIYKLPEVIEAIATGKVIAVVEGEAKADALWAWNVPATCCACGAGKWHAEHAEYLRGAEVVLLPDNDEPGFQHIAEVGATLAGVAKRVRVLLLPGLPPKGDIKDWMAAGGTREQLDTLVAQAPDWQPPPSEAPTDQNKAKAAADEQQLIDELARLNAADYDRRRKEAADELGMRRSTLDDMVGARRAEQADEAGPAPLFGHWMVEPWPEPVDTAALVVSIIDRVKKHVILSDDEALIVALWIMFAWVHDAAAVHSPILLVTSAEANSGKTQLLSLIGFLVPRSLLCIEISEATLFRGIEMWQPTVMVDEADVILINNEPLRAVINSGWTRGACVPRCIGDDNTPHAFPTFTPKVIGMKGRKLPDTTLSRSIIIEMKRKRTSERVEHFRSLDNAGLAELRRRSLRWSNDNGKQLSDAEPDMPAGFDNRLGDNWHLLLAIAELADNGWPDKTRQAASRLSRVTDVASTGSRLLADIKLVFDEAGVDRMSSSELVAGLTANPEARWSEWKRGKPITQAQLARELKPLASVRK
jgi:hypothetical protein